jgi:hypothetical protein
MELITLHRIKPVHDVGGKTNYERGPEISIVFDHISFLSLETYPKEDKNDPDAFYTEVGLTSGTVLAVFERPDEILEQIEMVKAEIIQEWHKNLLTNDLQKENRRS